MLKIMSALNKTLLKEWEKIALQFFWADTKRTLKKD